MLLDDNRRRQRPLLVDTSVFRLVTHRLFRGDQSWLSLNHGDGGAISGTSTIDRTSYGWIFSCGGDGVLMRY